MTQGRDSVGPGIHQSRPAPRIATPARAAVLAAALLLFPGCTLISHLGTDEHGREFGRTYFIGGAGSVGNVVGTFDVPAGLRKARYAGSIEVFAWQAVIGGTLRDQIDRNRNEAEGRDLAERIQAYLRKYPGRRVNIIALSAGTGIATWALEALPKSCRVGTVVYLASSMSRDYDLSAAMQRIGGHLYCFHSPEDPLLHYGLPLTGSVDREDTNAGAAGLAGFAVPAHASASARQLYARKLRNEPYKPEYAQYGYRGGHMDSVSASFIAHVVAPLLEEAPDRALRTAAGAPAP